MRLDLDTGDANFNQIRAYDDDKIQINDQTFMHSIIVTPTMLIDNWAPQSIADLTSESLQIIIELKPDIILVGTGAKLVFPHSALLAELLSQQIGVEVMSTAAACRTYNVLMSEGRNVAAGLILSL
jgi:uncharacterized protein